MNISTLVNRYGEKYSPYMSGIVNHLPMAQLTLYKMTGNLVRVEEFTEYYLKKFKLDPVEEENLQYTTIDKYLGMRSKYKSVLNILKKDLNKVNVEKYLSYILNTYDLGMSSGVFHPLIRIKHAVDGYKIDEKLLDEVRRALAYYITGYRQADIFKGNTNGKKLLSLTEKLAYDRRIREIVKSEETMGKKMRALYNDSQYIQTELLVSGGRHEKVESILDVLLPFFINTKNIVALHCITGLEALLGLEEYYYDFNRALDIFTTAAITHLLTLNKFDFKVEEDYGVEFSWDYILGLGTESSDVHNIKLTYSCHEISKQYSRRDLKRATLKKVDTI